MLPRPTATLHVTAATSRRALLADLVRIGGWALLWGAGLALLLIGLDRLYGGAIEWWWLAAGAMLLSAVVAVMLAVLRRWGTLRAAEEIDSALGLKDTLSSAIELTRSPAPGTDPSFAAWTVRQAESAAQSVRPSQVVKVRWGWPWGAWPAVLAGAIAVAFFVPAMEWGGAPAGPTREQIAARDAAAASVQEVAHVLASQPEIRDVAGEQELQTLDALHQELMSGRAQPQEARARAASELQSLASKLEDRAEQDRLSRDLLRDRMAMAAAQSRETGPMESPLKQAFERRDMEAAGELASELSRRLNEMTPQEREELARELEELARSMEEFRRSQQGTAPEQQSPGATTPEETIAPEHQPEGGEPPDAAPPRPQQRPDQPPQTREQIEQQLRDQGMDPEQARREAERRHQEEMQQRAEQEAQRRTEELEQSLRDAARELREPQQPRQPQQQEQPPRQPEERPDAQEDPQQQQGAEQPQPGQEQQPRPEPQPGQQQPQPGEQQQPRPEQRPAQQQPQPEPQPGQEPQQGEPQPAQQQQGEPQQGQQQQKDPGAQQQQPQPQPGAEQQDQPQPQPGQEEGQQQEQGEGAVEQQPRPGEQPGAEQQQQQQPGGMDRLIEQMKRMAKEEQQQPPSREQAERLRKMAQEMLREATPEQREELQRLAREFQRDQQQDAFGAGDEPSPLTARPPQAQPEPPRQTDPVDVRRRPAAEQQPRESVVAEWFTDRPVDRTGEPGTVSPAQSMQQAARSAEQAVERQVVPPRYSGLVRRVFQRYAEEAPRQP